MVATHGIESVQLMGPMLCSVLSRCFPKDWVYKQLCACTMPLHHLVTGLIEAFVTSVISSIPSSRAKGRAASPTLRGFTEAQVLAVFKVRAVTIWRFLAFERANVIQRLFQWRSWISWPPGKPGMRAKRWPVRWDEGRGSTLRAIRPQMRPT